MPDDVMSIAAHINAAAPSFAAFSAAAQAGQAADAADAPFNFGPLYETKAAALILRDLQFTRECIGFVKPEHFNNAVERNIVSLVLKFCKEYAAVPEPTTLLDLIKRSKEVLPAEHPVYIQKIVALMGLSLAERQFIRAQVVEFCRHQGLLRAAADIPTLLDKKDFQRIKSTVDRAYAIGTASSAQKIDFFERSADRKALREQLSKGMKKTGVPTGFDDIDRHLYHGGWGRGEVTVPMAPAKRGKTAFCLQSAAFSAVKHGTKVLLISLEVNETIMQDRLDACLASIEMNDLVDQRDQVDAEIAKLAKGPGRIFVEARPANSFSTDQVDSLIESYINDGIALDMVVVDYIGILRLSTPDDRFVGLGTATKELRRIAGKYNIAILAPAQTNRDALAKSIAGMDSIGESFQVVQDCDLLLSINADAQMLAAGVRLINFAASRNQAEVTFRVKGDLARMRMVESVLSVEH